MTLRELAERINAQLISPDPDAGMRQVRRCARLEEAGPDDLTFLVNPRYAGQLAETQAAAVIVGPEVNHTSHTLLRAEDAYFAFRNAMVALHGFVDHGPAEVSNEARIDPTARLGDDCHIHPLAVIAAGATLGDRCVVYPHCYVGRNATLGDDCVLHPNVVVYHDCMIGHRVTLHAGCVIGQDGFGYATHQGVHHKIPQTGNVVIEDDVEMGANCTVDRATLGQTIIGAGTKMSDAVTIGHGCHVGKANLFVGQVGLAGSVNTGDYVAMGGQVGVAGHLNIGDRAQIAATSGVITDIPEDAQVGGTPAQPLIEAKRIFLLTQRLPDLIQRIKSLERQVEQMEND
jgi:UDP-3-O-[3-hydroxymyristoyl] glucosamine N-acyltransferase